jgi:hypothetical protein
VLAVFKKGDISALGLESVASTAQTALDLPASRQKIVFSSLTLRLAIPGEMADGYLVTSW